MNENKRIVWTECHLPYSCHISESESFVNRIHVSKEPRVGLLLELAVTPPGGDSKFVLIGDINFMNGGCSCCGGIPDDMVVIRYRRVWMPEIKTT